MFSMVFTENIVDRDIVSLKHVWVSITLVRKNCYATEYKNIYVCYAIKTFGFLDEKMNLGRRVKISAFLDIYS